MINQLETVLILGGTAFLIAGIINLLTIKTLYDSQKLKEQASKIHEETINLRKVILEERIATTKEE